MVMLHLIGITLPLVTSQKFLCKKIVLLISFFQIIIILPASMQFRIVSTDVFTEREALLVAVGATCAVLWLFFFFFFFFGTWQICEEISHQNSEKVVYTVPPMQWWDSTEIRKF